MRQTDFQQRWAAIYEWVASPRLILQDGGVRAVAVQGLAQGEDTVTILEDHLRSDSMGDWHWVQTSAFILHGRLSLKTLAWLVLLEAAHNKQEERNG